MFSNEYIAKIAKEIAADNRYGYSNDWPNNRFSDDPNDKTPKDGDCGAFMSYCLNMLLKLLGINSREYFEPQGGWSIYNEAYLLKYCNRYNYEDVRNKVGDILVSGGHTVMITAVDPDYITHAANDYDGRSGDSGGSEIRTQRLYDGGWHYIYRLKDKYNIDLDKKEESEDIDIMAALKKLYKGCEGMQVKNLQALLNVWVRKDPLLIDGIFGDLTEEKLKIYQKAQGLTVTGICDIITWNDILTNDN